MKLTDTIIFSMDIDADSSDRIEVLKYFAEYLKSKIVLLSVLPDDIRNESVKMRTEKSVKTDLGKIADDLKAAGTESEIVLRYGKPAETISHLAEEHNAGLIMVEARNCEKTGNYSLGTVTSRLLHISEKPVMVTKIGQEAGFSNIICPIDFSKPSELALENAVLLAKVLKAKLRVLSVDESLSHSRSSQNWDARDQEQLEGFAEKTKKFLKKFNTTGLDISIETETGEPHEAILHSIKANKHDLLIMGTTGKTGLRRILMGSVTEKVIREVPCSFITTKAEDMVQLQVDTDITEFSDHYETANQLFEKGFYAEAKAQYNICLKINSMHVPSLFKLAKIYKKMDKPEKSEHYHKMALSILNKVWDKQIEHEIRKHYS